MIIIFSLSCAFNHSLVILYMTYNNCMILCNVTVTLPTIPCRPLLRTSSYSIGETSAMICWSRSTCSRSTHAEAVRYYVSCANQILTSMCATLRHLRPNTYYQCYIYGIDSVGRYGTALQITFTTSTSGKLEGSLLH